MEKANTDYEQQRNARVGANQNRMRELGLLDLSRSLSTPASREGSRGRRKSRDYPLPIPAPAIRRRSSRLVGTTQPCYTEVVSVEKRIVATDARQIQPEIYTEEHEKLLGKCSQDWELFKDGYAADGTRVYDSAVGKTCHQCRQKTMGLRTFCSQCESLRGQFCGDCLFMRYGENVIEAKQNNEWVCPVCRGICNCSFCRIRKGWAPTGSMYRLASKLNYKSVAHYLIMTRGRASEVQLDPEEEKFDTATVDEKAKDQEVQSSAEDEQIKDKEICISTEDEEKAKDQKVQSGAEDEEIKDKEICISTEDEEIEDKEICVSKDFNASRDHDGLVVERRSLRLNSRRKGRQCR